MKHSSEPFGMAGRTKAARLSVIALLIGAVTVLHYTTMHTKVAFHTLYRELYLVPILAMSFWYGLRAGLVTALVVAGLYAPHVVMTWHDQPGVNLGNFLQILVFIALAVTMGYLSDRERERQQQLRTAENLASVGRAAQAMTAELQELLEKLRDSLTQAAVSRETEQDFLRVIEKLVVLEQAVSGFGPGDSRRHLQVVEVNPFIRRSHRYLAKLAKKKGIPIETQLDQSRCVVQIDEKDLLWILEQLIINAVENSDPDRDVTIQSRRTNGYCRISVTDRGRGISEQNMPKIFVPFFTTKEKGTGLGLAVCRKIVRDHGGDMEVGSEEGKGSTFSLTLPRAFATPSELEAEK